MLQGEEKTIAYVKVFRMIVEDRTEKKSAKHTLINSLNSFINSSLDSRLHRTNISAKLVRHLLNNDLNSQSIKISSFNELLNSRFLQRNKGNQIVTSVEKSNRYYKVARVRIVVIRSQAILTVIFR